ncbi:MAG: hypothetical protein CL609_16645 [Anaerolineaceae bacterium]|nr:hypothetical protein [Anaerolineaceae bacterium]
MRDIDQAWSTLQIKDNFSQLPYSIQILMREYYQVRNREGENLMRLEKMADDLLKVSKVNGTALEIALSTIEFAIIQTRKGSFHKAYRLIEEAAVLLRENPATNEIHYQTFAASFWLLGCLEYARGSSRAEILKCWQKALTLYEKLSNHELMLYTGQYRYNIRRMQETISAFISERSETVNSSHFITNAESTLQLALPTFSLFKPVTLFSGQTKVLDVYHTIPAGPLTELEDPPEPLESFPLQKEQAMFLIDKQGFQLFRLDGTEQTIHLNSQLHIVLRVEGDSMNLANIDDGDYILLRLQNDASHEDIVAAQIIEKGAEPQATLKRFERDGKKINLKAESSNPKNKSYPFVENDLNHKLSIIGVAIGVFKPNNTWTREN